MCGQHLLLQPRRSAARDPGGSPRRSSRRCCRTGRPPQQRGQRGHHRDAGAGVLRDRSRPARARATRVRRAAASDRRPAPPPWWRTEDSEIRADSFITSPSRPVKRARLARHRGGLDEQHVAARTRDGEAGGHSGDRGAAPSSSSLRKGKGSPRRMIWQKRWRRRYPPRAAVTSRCFCFRRTSPTVSHPVPSFVTPVGPPQARASRSRFGASRCARRRSRPPGAPQSPETRFDVEGTALDLGHRRVFAGRAHRRTCGTGSASGSPRGPIASSCAELGRNRQPTTQLPHILNGTTDPRFELGSANPIGTARPACRPANEGTPGHRDPGSDTHLPRPAPRLRHPRLAHCRRPRHGPGAWSLRLALRDLRAQGHLAGR